MRALAAPRRRPCDPFCSPFLLVFCVALTAPSIAASLQGPLTRVVDGWALPPRGGRLEVREGTRVLHLEGDVAERGFAEGYLCADELLECFNEFALGHVVARRPLAWDLIVLPGVRARFEFGDDTRRWAEGVIAGATLARRERGADLTLAPLGRALGVDDVLACAAIPDLAGLLCSSFAVWGEGTAFGDVLVGRNLDYPSTPAIERHSLVHVHAPRGDRAGWIGVGWPGSPGCLTGLSDRGVFVAIHDVPAPRPDGDGRFTPRSLALQELVEELRPSDDTPKDALARLRRHRFTMGGNVLLAWQAASSDEVHASDLETLRGKVSTPRGAVVLELDGRRSVDEGVTVRFPELGEPFVVCSNHHRARDDDGHGCDRYGALLAGARRSAKGSTAVRPLPLDGPRAWDLIGESEMGITLYRCVADLGARTLGLERSTDTGWRPRISLGFGP
jgi:hypothetical protein